MNNIGQNVLQKILLNALVTTDILTVCKKWTDILLHIYKKNNSLAGSYLYDISPSSAQVKLIVFPSKNHRKYNINSMMNIFHLIRIAKETNFKGLLITKEALRVIMSDSTIFKFWVKYCRLLECGVTKTNRNFNTKNIVGFFTADFHVLSLIKQSQNMKCSKEIVNIMISKILTHNACKECIQVLSMLKFTMFYKDTHLTEKILNSTRFTKEEKASVVNLILTSIEIHEQLSKQTIQILTNYWKSFDSLFAHKIQNTNEKKKQSPKKSHVIRCSSIAPIIPRKVGKKYNNEYTTTSKRCRLF